jgi:dsDNA-specific endonuclease/ATPase MutS2
VSDEEEIEELPQELPIDGTLDLHTFAPREVGAVVEAYLEEAAARGLPHVRIVHGKGIGALRRTVESVLRRSPHVRSFRLADGAAGGWGATLVELEGGAGRGRGQGDTG